MINDIKQWQVTLTGDMTVDVTCDSDRLQWQVTDERWQWQETVAGDDWRVFALLSLQYLWTIIKTNKSIRRCSHQFWRSRCRLNTTTSPRHWDLYSNYTWMLSRGLHLFLCIINYESFILSSVNLSILPHISIQFLLRLQFFFTQSIQCCPNIAVLLIRAR